MRSLKSHILWCSRVQWVLWTCMLVLAGAFYAFGYRPAEKQLTQLQDDTREQRRQLHEMEGRARTLQQVIEDVRMLRARLDASRQLPKHKNISQFIMDVERISRQASLKDYSFDPDAAPIRHELFRQLPIRLKFKGDFNNVFTFLQQTEQLQRLTRVRQINIKTIANDPGQVDVTVLMNLYYSAED
jgi:Tfp pilus assembly protein PilO